MKLLIIAGPYEADRVRRAVVAAGYEAVAVEPGESLSGWITASRPDLIVLAPQIVNPDPAVALAKVRSVPRGRVPTFLVGDPDDEPRMKGLADGFLVRPLSTSDLIERVRARLDRGTTGELRRPVTGETSIPTPTTDVTSADFARAGTSKSGSGGARPLPTLKPLVAAADMSAATPVPRARPSEAGALFLKLAESIDAALDAEMFDMARSVGALRREVPPPPPPPPGSRTSPKTGSRGRPAEDLLERTPMAPMTALAAAAALPLLESESTALSAIPPRDPFEESGDETRQKTVEVPRDVFAKVMAERVAVARDGHAGAPAPVESGKIGDGDVAALLGRMHLQCLTGRMHLRHEGIEKIIYFDSGAPILGTSSDSLDRMGEMLVRQGRLSAVQLARASEGLPSRDRRLGNVLVELGFIKASELPVLVRRHFEEIIHSAFAWEDGEWALGPGQPSQEIVLLDEHPAALILEGIRRKYGAARLVRCLGGASQIFKLSAGAAADTADLLPRLGLLNEERAIVPLFDGMRTLDEVRGHSQAREEVVLGVAWALSVLGYLDRIEPSVAQGPTGKGKGKGKGKGNSKGDGKGNSKGDWMPGVANGAGDSAQEHERRRDQGREQSIDRARVLARYAMVEEGDYFQVLGLPRSASAQDVRRAHDALMQAFAPTSLDPALVAELGAELRAIRGVLDEALRVLGEPGLRQRYETNLPAAAEQAAG